MRGTEDDRLLRGAGRFVADISFPGQLNLAFLRSQEAHARIRSIDVRPALEVPGVERVMLPSDFPGGPLPQFLWDIPEELVAAPNCEIRPCHPPLLAADKVCYVGEALAVVVAASRYVAEDAAELIEVDYEPLDAGASIAAALARGAALVHNDWPDNIACRLVVTKGDAAEAMRTAKTVVREQFRIQRQAGIPIETRGAVGIYEHGRLTLWSSTQNPHPLRRAMSNISGLPERDVRIVAPDVGGGFGIKANLYPEDIMVGLIALQLGRPIKWVEDRTEHMLSAVHAREQEHDIELGLSDDGEIVALRDRISVDAGAYNPLGLLIPYNTIAHLAGPYRVPHFEAAAAAVITNKTPTAPYRGAGRPEAVFAVERILDRAAHALGVDPLALRLQNLVRPDEMPFERGTLYRDGRPIVLDGGDYPAALRTAAKVVGRAQPDDEGRLLGVGFACYVEGTGIGPYESARVTVDRDGHVMVHTGACSQGQGHGTVLAQVCADALGVEPSSVTVVGGDTDGIATGWGTFASRSAVVAGNAVAEAARIVRDKALDAAKRLLEASGGDLTIDAGRVVVSGVPSLGLSLGEIAEALEAENDRLEAQDSYEPPTVTWAYGAHAALVAVDVETGQVEILRYVVVHDCGRVINPAIVEGQLRGGVVQGIGGALYEEIIYGEDGQLQNATLADYVVPTADEVPPIVLVHMETPSPLNALGVRGVGEGGAIGPPAAIANAVENALAPRDIVVRTTPLGPSHVLALLHGTEDHRHRL